MMNRGVMDRQMFAKGGAAFPDLSGDGKVTQRDILMGRGVVPMQQGGDPMAMAAMMPPPQDAPPMAPPMAPSQGVAVDPAILEEMLTRAGQGLGDLEEADNYEEMMNMMRGDQASIPERREELADLVGPEDAAQTPESVLALVQPVVQLAAVDQGIGGLAQEQMVEAVEGPMAGGIMSTMEPPTPPVETAPPPMPPAGMGGPPPVNFNQGGLVRRGDNQPVIKMQAGGDPIAQAGRLGELYEEKVPLYQSILGDQSAAVEEQKKLTQAQMLFDIANTALAFAGPMEGERRGMSPAERLAMATQKTQLLPTISARSAEQLKAKQAADAKTQQMQ